MGKASLGHWGAVGSVGDYISGVDSNGACGEMAHVGIGRTYLCCVGSLTQCLLLGPWPPHGTRRIPGGLEVVERVVYGCARRRRLRGGPNAAADAVGGRARRGGNVAGRRGQGIAVLLVLLAEEKGHDGGLAPGATSAGVRAALRKAFDQQAVDGRTAACGGRRQEAGGQSGSGLGDDGGGRGGGGYERSYGISMSQRACSGRRGGLAMGCARRASGAVVEAGGGRMALVVVEVCKE